MNKSSRKNNKTPLGFLLSLEGDHQYFHLNCVIVRWDEDGKMRNISDSESINGFLKLGDLKITSQGNSNEKAPRHLYAWDLRYVRPYSVDYRDAERMYRTLRKILDRMDRVSAKRGRAKTYAEYVGRLAEILGVTKILYANGRSKGWSYDDGDYHSLPLGEGIDYIGWVVKRWEACEELPVFVEKVQ